MVCWFTLSQNAPSPTIQVFIDTGAGEEVLLVLKSEWDTKDAKCWLAVELPEAKPGDQCRMALDQIWKISQYALEPFLFSKKR